ncbi:fibroblast growth factor 21 [Engraulis encrasicolus]|uniref:fibroblast growth factor 21 n=1 Tax=Engraulis encrasicolus TaxID=184585 RepID=UPI002FD79C09
MSLHPSVHLLILPILLPSLSLCFYVPSSDVLSSFSDQVRYRHLYTESKKQALFLELKADGSVGGSPTMSQYTSLELRSIKAGHAVIKGLASSRFLCVDRNGHFRGEHTYQETDCNLQELLLADGYSLFLSPRDGRPLSLGRRGGHTLSKFLPLAGDRLSNGQTHNKDPQETMNAGQYSTNVDSDDPLGMAQSHSRYANSPSLDLER